MNAIDLLKEDHQTVRDLYAEYREMGVRSAKRKTDMVREICGMLEAHAEIEEKLFYPPLEGTAPDLIKEAREEHSQVKQMIADLKKIEGKDDKLEDLYVTFNKMMEAVEHHVEEEETELFPVAQSELKDRLDEIGEKMRQRKQEILKAA